MIKSMYENMKFLNNANRDLHDALTTPPKLRKAHHENDFAVTAVDGFDKKITKSECVVELMRRYRMLTQK